MDVKYDFGGQVLVVTGGGSGIGAGLCRSYAEAGGTAVCMDIQTDLMAELAASSPRIETHVLDVSDSEQVAKCFDEVLQKHGQIDALVMSAAVQPRSRIDEMNDEEWRRVMRVNLDGAMQCSRAVIPSMRERRKGSIVTFTSGLATTGWAGASAYATTKAGLIAFTKSLARELLSFHVRANVLAPGVTDSPLFTGPNTIEEQEYFRKNKGNVGTVEDVVKLLMFMVSDASTSLTGSVVDRELIFPPHE